MPLQPFCLPQPSLPLQPFCLPQLFCLPQPFSLPQLFSAHLHPPLSSAPLLSSFHPPLFCLPQPSLHPSVPSCFELLLPVFGCTHHSLSSDHPNLFVQAVRGQLLRHHHTIPPLPLPQSRCTPLHRPSEHLWMHDHLHSSSYHFLSPPDHLLTPFPGCHQDSPRG